MANELDILAKTDHPHIVRTKEIIEDENNFYIISELVTGGELYNKILEKRKFNE
jgi:serine/threonine protein kinase